MFTVIITLTIIVCVLLMLVILAQNPKGGGLSSQFGGSGASQIMGVKKTGDLLEKITWTLAITLLVLSLSTNFLITNPADSGLTSPNVDKAQDASPNFNTPSLETQPSGSAEDADADLLDQLSTEEAGAEDQSEGQE